MPNTLRASFKRLFYPFAESRGFVRIPSSDPFFTEFRKVDGDLIYTLDVQWDKYHRPYFVFNFNAVEGGSVKPRTQSGRLQRTRGAGLNSWFHLKRPWLEVIRTLRIHYEPDEVVEYAIACFPEIEAWWANGEEGKHIVQPVAMDLRPSLPMKIKVLREACCAADDQVGPLSLSLEFDGQVTLQSLVESVVASGFLQYSSSHTSMFGYFGEVAVVRVYSPYHSTRETEYLADPATPIQAVSGNYLVDFRF
ncbi:hypothetical protein GJ699_03810 [Duganella sp. FT80W]|uniref:Uncharacterized protein n=1 Tax=Duganella guangzhouensis TaxID=2666084 RepID=A0A6I2KXF7_9BURK|nr:hypothetical protein [Duganella guangzhouensis]MRW89104.1 hypothetical protein [Duganella guangzhouensis]